MKYSVAAPDPVAPAIGSLIDAAAELLRTYTIDGITGSIASALTVTAVRPLLIADHVLPPFVVLKTPDNVPA